MLKLSLPKIQLNQSKPQQWYKAEQFTCNGGLTLPSDFKHGTKIQVTWPDGMITNEQLILRSVLSDLVIKINYHGRLVEVPLKGLRIALAPKEAK